MLDYYALSFDHVAVLGEPTYVYRWVRITPNQMEGNTYFRQVPVLKDGEVLEAVVGGASVYLKNHGPNLLCEISPKELVEYIIKKSLT